MPTIQDHLDRAFRALATAEAKNTQLRTTVDELAGLYAGLELVRERSAA